MATHNGGYTHDKICIFYLVSKYETRKAVNKLSRVQTKNKTEISEYMREGILNMFTERGIPKYIFDTNFTTEITMKNGQ